MKRVSQAVLLLAVLMAAREGRTCGWMRRSGPELSAGWGTLFVQVDSTDAWTLPVSAPSLCDYNSECQPSLTADGKTLYYAIGRVNGPAPDSLCWCSTDDGETWKLMDPLAGAWEALCLLRTSDGAVLAGTTPNGDVYRWTPMAADEEPTRRELSLQVSGWTRDVRSITYALPQPGHVWLRIHNAVGRAVATPVDGFVSAGAHTVHWKVRGPGGELLPNGVYFMILQTDRGSLSARTVIAR